MLFVSYQTKAELLVFISALFNAAFIIERQQRRVVGQTNNELESIWKEAVVA
jgi:hypothetical protein